MIDGTTIAIVAVCVTLMVHLVTSVWWASKLTNRMEHVERWITTNENMSQRLIAIETKLDILMRRNNDTST